MPVLLMGVPSCYIGVTVSGQACTQADLMTFFDWYQRSPQASERGALGRTAFFPF